MITLYKYTSHVKWDAKGTGVTIIGGSGGGIDIASYLANYYTKIELQTAGLAQVHFDNITEAYHNNLLGLQGGKVITDSSGTPSSEGDDEFYHLDEETYTRVVTWEFLDSLIEESDGTIHLVNDEDDPGILKYYGTDITGTKGWWELLIGEDSSGLAYVSAYGTPVNNQISIWIDEDTIKGSADFTFDGTTLLMTKDFQTHSDETSLKLGIGALHSASVGPLYNTAIGYQALYTITTGGVNNVAIGYQSLYKDTTGYRNVGIGNSTLYENIGGYSNVGIGEGALYKNIGGYDNVGIGEGALYENTEGHNNLGIGIVALYSNTTGQDNIGIGPFALYYNTIGLNNVGIGNRALYKNTQGHDNLGIGLLALQENTTGYYNVGIGSQALLYNTTGDNNIAIGFSSGIMDKEYNTITICDNSVFIGNYSKANADSETNQIVIGYEAIGQGSYTTIIGGVDNLKTYLIGEIYFVEFDSTNTIGGGSLPLADSSITQVVMYDPTTGKLYYGAGEGGTVSYTFSMSLNEDSTGIVTLDNDEASPGNYKFYGTDASGNKGWYDLQTVIELFA